MLALAGRASSRGNAESASADGSNEVRSRWRKSSGVIGKYCTCSRCCCCSYIQRNSTVSFDAVPVLGLVGLQHLCFDLVHHDGMVVRTDQLQNASSCFCDATNGKRLAGAGSVPPPARCAMRQSVSQARSVGIVPTVPT